MTDNPRTLRILLAEDSEEDALLLTRHLRKSGYDPLIQRVETASDFRACVGDETWDLIISDYQMPGFSGMEALSIYGDADLEIPFLLVSGTIGEDIAVEAMRAGATDYLLKGNLARLGPAIDRELRELESRRKQKESVRRQQRLEAAIQSILLGTASSIGVDFFRSLVKELAKALGVKATVISKLSSPRDGRAETLALHGIDWIPEGFSYEIDGTPAEQILKDGWLSLPIVDFAQFRNFQRQSHMFTGLVGIRLDASDGTPMGLLTVFDDKPMSEEALAKDILSIFGARAASEMQRIRAENERNNLQEQLWHSQKLEAIGTLAGGISHDINNILSSIWGHAQILEMRGSVSVRDQESLKGILVACRRARDLVKQILSFSRKSTPETHILQFGDIVQETVSLLRATIPTNISITTFTAPGTPPIKADSNQLHQVLMNLCTNASHAMESTNGGRLEIDVRPFATSDGTVVRCTVSDNGSGIPDHVVPRIFEPFFTTKISGKGTGLGLSVVYGIVRNHSGTIHVESKIGAGTKFTIDFPCLPDDTLESRSQENSNMPLGSSQKILVVDDEAAVSDVLCQLLEIIGYLPVSFSDPSVALEAFRKDPGIWSAVITDRTMPVMNGEELALAMQKIRPDIPIVMSSGYEGDLRTSDLAETGIQALLPKPFQASDLAVLLRRILVR